MKKATKVAICKMTLVQAQKALAQELRWKANGLSYSGRRLGDLRRRIALWGPA